MKFESKYKAFHSQTQKYIWKGSLCNGGHFVHGEISYMPKLSNIKFYWNGCCLPHVTQFHCVNTLRPRQNRCHFTDNILNCIFLNENVWISLKFVLQGLINNISALVQIMAWHRPGNKPLSGPMMVRLPTHICIIGLNDLRQMVPSFSQDNFFIHWNLIHIFQQRILIFINS